MIKVLRIVSHGKYSDVTELGGKIIKCPECENTGYHSGCKFRIETT